MAIIGNKTMANSTSFKKGQIANPNGRPKGSYSLLRKQLMELRKLAANDINDMYDKLKNAISLGKEWAYQIYFKELVSVPKEWLNEVDTSRIPKQIKNVENITEVSIALASALLEVDSMSIDEVNSTIKTLNNIKLSEQFGKQKENPFDKLSAEKMLTIKKWLDEA